MRNISTVDEAVSSLVDSGEIAGAVVLAVKNGETVHSKAYGVSDITTGQEMAPDTIFRIFSMTKPITTVAAMMLWEEGKIELDAPVSQYIPELKDFEVLTEDGAEVKAERDPTIRDLMRHTSGFDYGFLGGALSERYQEKKILDSSGTLADMTRKLATLPLAYQPGTRFNYSVSTDVLGRVVERVSATDLNTFFQERIFAPLGMVDTDFTVPKEKVARFAANHALDPQGKLVRIDDPETSDYTKDKTFLSGGGGLVGTAGDYGRFCQMLVNGGVLEGKRLLKEETVALMTTNQIPDQAMPIGVGDSRPGVGFGLGFSVRVAEDPEDPGIVGEYGWGGAASTHFWISPKDKLFVVTMRNFMPYQSTLENKLKPLIYDGANF